MFPTILRRVSYNSFYLLPPPAIFKAECDALLGHLAFWRSFGPEVIERFANTRFPTLASVSAALTVVFDELVDRLYRLGACDDDECVLSGEGFARERLCAAIVLIAEPYQEAITLPLFESSDPDDGLIPIGSPQLTLYAVNTNNSRNETRYHWQLDLGTPRFVCQ